MSLSLFSSLIFPLRAELKQMDLEATDDVSDFNDVLREPVKVDTDADGIGESTLRYKDPILLLAQVENQMGEKERLARGGDMPDTFIRLVLSRRQLLNDGLIDETGRVYIQPGDRLVSLRNQAGEVVRTFDQPPGGLYCTQVRHGDAYIGQTSNLIFAEFEDRPQGARGV